MSVITQGVVANGVIIPNSPLPEGAIVEIELKANGSQPPLGLSASELRKLPRAQRQAALEAAAALAEEDYRTDKNLTGFDAFGEEELDDDDSR